MATTIKLTLPSVPRRKMPSETTSDRSVKARA
jgi:hypothetical protein